MHPGIGRPYAVICALSGAVGSYFLQLAAALPAAIRRHAALLAFIFIYWVCGLVVAQAVGIPPGTTVTTYIPTYMAMMPLMIVTLVVGRGAVIMVHDRPERPLTQLMLEMRTTLATPQRVAHALPMLAGTLVFGATFTVIKTAIPFFAPFSWDPTFEQWDRWLHGGIAPWQIIQPILGSPLLTFAVGSAYNVWFYFLSLIWVWQAFSQRDYRLRLQFFLTLMIGWILLGNVAATLFSSAGPCFFGKITGLSDPFLPLMIYLTDANQAHNIWALAAQKFLWHGYTMRELTIGAGISAMPSMHVGIATLFALVCWRTRRWLGIVMTIYAIVVMIGSVHLAWHYAIDGYLGAIGIMVIWWAVGRALARQDEKEAKLTVTDAA